MLAKPAPRNSATFQKEVIETVVAFTNAKGGQILIGVSDAKHIKGFVINHGTLKDWFNQIKNNTVRPFCRTSIRHHLARYG